MRTSMVIAAMVLTGALAPALFAGGAVEWTSDFEAAKKAAAEQKKQLFLEFTAEW